MKRISIIILCVFLLVAFTLSGCTKTEYVTVTDTTTATTTLPIVTTTETTTFTTSGERHYSSRVYLAIIAYVMQDLEAKGSADLIAGFAYGGDHMKLLFYDDADEEIVEFVQSAINEIAPPGLPLEVYENVTIEEQ